MPASSPGEQVDDLGLEARALRPAQVHAHEHLRPVLRLGAAGAGMDGEDRGLRCRAVRRASPSARTRRARGGSSAAGPAAISASRLSSPASVAISQRSRTSPASRGELAERLDRAAPARRAPGSAPGPAGCRPRRSAPTSRRRWRLAALPCRGGQRCLRSSSRRRSRSAMSRFSSPSMCRQTSSRVRIRVRSADSAETP